MVRNLGYDFALRAADVVGKGKCSTRRWGRAKVRTRRMLRLAPRRHRAQKLARASIVLPSVAFSTEVAPPSRAQRIALERMLRATLGVSVRGSDVALAPAVLGGRYPPGVEKVIVRPLERRALEWWVRSVRDDVKAPFQGKLVQVKDLARAFGAA